MPKKGQAQPFRIDFEWSNGTKGCKRFTYRDQLDAFIAEQQRIAGYRELTITQTITENWNVLH